MAAINDNLSTVIVQKCRVSSCASWFDNSKGEHSSHGETVVVALMAHGLREEMAVILSHVTKTHIKILHLINIVVALFIIALRDVYTSN